MKRIVTAFKEHKEFKKNRPWDVNDMYFPTDIFTPPHYAETIEIILCRDLKGTAYIGGKRYDLSGRKTFFIAPDVIHTLYHEKSDGKLINIKLVPHDLTSSVLLQNILANEQLDFFSIPCEIPELDRLYPLAEKLRFSNRETLDPLIAILEMFQIFREYANPNLALRLAAPSLDEELQNIISWTEDHFHQKISLDDAAEQTGYSKHYFCSKFRNATGCTYLQYLNTLRITHACRLLKSGTSITDVCESCGFENMSYFIQLFKKTMGTTPKQYALEKLRQESKEKLF